MKLLRIENYVGYVKDRAYANWVLLPAQVKSWMEFEDFVNEGLTFVRFNVMPKFDPRRGVQFATLLYKSVDRYYKLRRHALCRKSRLAPGVMLSIGITINANGEEEEVDVAAKTFDLHSALQAETGLLKVYKSASPRLKKQMAQWFFDRGGTRKVRKQSMLFNKSKKEFKKLAKEVGLTVELCRSFLERRRQTGYHVKVKRRA